MTLPLETSKSPVEKWKVWADSACGARGSRIRILLQIQTRIKLRYTVKLAFNTTNSIAEYEAVVMALKIVAKIGI